MKWQVQKAEKLVSFLQGKLGSYSGKFLRKVLEANLCRINGRIERFGSRVVQGGDAVELAVHWKTAIGDRPIRFDSLFETEDFLIVNKPAGWVCEPKNAVQTWGPKHYLVHRLDKETTGLLLVAKNEKARDELMGLFENKEICKSYLALVDGVPQEKRGVRRSLLGKRGSFQGQTIWGSGQQGLTAVTEWELLFGTKNASLLLCKPLTGRTHQIRVHLAEMGHPILVDRQYASSFRCPLFFQRPLLHAYRLEFSFRSHLVCVEAPLFADMQKALQELFIPFGIRGCFKSKF